MDTFLAAMHAAGLDALVPLLLALHALASALDALVPQPAAGSHWLPLRKLLSAIALNVGHATNAQQPTIMTWLQRIAGLVVALLPPPSAAPPATSARAEPLFPQPYSPPPTGAISPASAMRSAEPSQMMPPMPSAMSGPPA